MNSRLILLSLFTALCLPAMGQIAQPLGNHYTPGIEGLEGGSLPPPGFYTRNYFYSYQADRVTNGQGAREPIGFQTMVFAIAPRLLYITPYKILGADYGCSIVLPFVYDHTKISAFDLDQSRVGLADIYVEPLDLSWHLPQADFLVTAGVYTPTGTFSTSNESSLGSGFWTQMTTAGATFYADKERAWHLSLLDRLEFSSRQEQTGLTPGNGELVEWGLGHSVDFTKEAGGILDIGPTGYVTWQYTPTTSDNDSLNHHEEQAVAFGGEASWFMPAEGWIFSLRGEHDFITRYHPQGDTMTLTITKRF